MCQYCDIKTEWSVHMGNRGVVALGHIYYTAQGLNQEQPIINLAAL